MVSTAAGMKNEQYSPKSIGSTRDIPANGHCPGSPVGAHWWILEPPSVGQVSIGLCRYCHSCQKFLNWFNEEFKK